MEHLTSETLARLVDEAPSTRERKHLGECESCRVELEAMVQQTRSLAQLPLDEFSAAALGWGELEAVLKDAGVLTEGRVPARPRPLSRPSPAWMRVAAAFVVFALGGAAGWGVRGGIASAPDASGVEVLGPVAAPAGELVVLEGAPPPSDPVALSAASQPSTRPDPRGMATSEAAATQSIQAPLEDEANSITLSLATFLGPAPVQFISLTEAEEMVHFSEALYTEALLGYRDLLSESGFEPQGDPVSRYVALGNVVAITEEAVRAAPTDPFWNGLLINALVEREAVGRWMMAFAPEP